MRTKDQSQRAGTTSSLQHLSRENEDLRRRLGEAEDALRALQAGEADAIVVEAGGHRVFILEAADRPYALMVAQVPQPAAIVTPDGTIISCNQRFADRLMRPLPAVIGEPLEDFAAPEGRKALLALLGQGLAAEVQAEATFRGADGKPVGVHLGVRPLSEGVRGTCLLVTDLTEQRHYEQLRRTQEALRATQEQLDLAQRAGRVGTFEWNIETGAVSWSASNEELYGAAAGGFGGRVEDWRQAIHPDDRERVMADGRRAVAERIELDTEFRIIRPDSETRWIATRGRVFYGPDGKPLRMLGVSVDITERKRAEEALQTADRRKDEFLATLAHELRSPLAPIRNAVEILKAKGPPDPELDWCRGVLDRQVQVMARLLEDLLDVSRITRASLELRTQRVDLGAVLAAALETSRPVVEAGGHQLVVGTPPERLYVDADPVRLAQVFANLLTNAAKYTESGGRITLGVSRQGGELTVSVKDSGIGLAPEAMPHIFEIFSQAAPALGRSQGGLGIGLSLAKGLVELHRGTIEARSEGPGRGSEFVVRLPLAAETPAPGAPVVLEAKATPPTPYRILIADDNPDAADSMAALLKIMGHEVGTAYDGEQAVAAAEAMRAEVAILDIGMPRLNGYEACRRIREQPWGRAMYVIALTGWGQEEDHRRTEDAGFDGHMVKPADPAALMRMLPTLSARKSAAAEDESDTPGRSGS